MPGAGIIVLCVKPSQAGRAIATLREAGLRPDTLLVSILAGTTLQQLEALTGTDNPWVRAMPNTPCIVGEGMTVICRGTHATPVHLARARQVFECVGQLRPDRRNALQRDHRAQRQRAGVSIPDHGSDGRCRRPRRPASRAGLSLVAQTALGSARMVQSSGRHPAALRDDVTTPAGCTIGGLLMLEDGKIRSVLARAIEEATRIAGQLGPSK